MTPTRPGPALAVAASLVLLTSCAAGTGPGAGEPAAAQARPGAPLPPVQVETGVVHVHGMGVDPGDGVLYAATHSGLFRIPEGGSAERVANRAQDTMGFAVVGPGRFIGSGHPDAREDAVRPPLLGLIESDDAGRTWTRRSLHGRADFHALAAAHGQVYGYDATSGTFMVSRDRQEWDRRSRLAMGDFAVDPLDPDRVVGTGAQGTIVSVDGGRTWSPLEGAPRLAVLAWDEASGLWGVDPSGRVHGSVDGGATWTAAGSVGGEPEALAVETGGAATSVFVAVAGQGILVSADGGASFSTRYAEGRP